MLSKDMTSGVFASNHWGAAHLIIMQKFFYSVNNWLVDSPTGSLIHLVNGEKKRLGEYQIKLLEVLLENAGRIMSREELTALVWERRVIGSNSLPNAIHALRAALEDDGKLQRIIKTLPKKGYILEAEYCVQVEKEESRINGILTEGTEDKEIGSEDVISAESFESPEQETAANQLEIGPFYTEQSEISISRAPLQPGPHSAYRFSLMVLAGIAFTLLITLASSYLMHLHDTHLTLSSRQQKMFDHITIYEVRNSLESHPDKTDMYLFSRLKDSYTRLNQTLKSRSVNMTVYYHYVQQTLNYTFVLKSRCDEKQMLIYFYHWHSDNAELNQTIFDNTMSTLNEMATCQ